MRRICRIPVARCRAYVAEGLTLRQIAEREGWCQDTVSTHLNGLGMTTRRPARIETSDIISIAYGAETVAAVARRREVTRAAVHKAAKKFGLRVGRGHERTA